MKNDQEFIERRIISGLIVSKDYIERVQKFWNPALLDSTELRTVAKWCLNYFQKYKKAPNADIQDLYMEALKTNSMSKVEAQYIEELLSDLSEDYDRGPQFNSDYLYDQTVKYFKSQELERHNREVEFLIESGQVEAAEELAASYKPSVLDSVVEGLELSSEEALNAVDRAFTSAYVPVVSYPGALGDMWNEHLVRGGFFTLLAGEKRGKSFMLMEIALRAIRQKANVAFFEAGDMTEAQVLRRICIYISQKPDKEKYCQERFRPVGDCLLNQIDACNRDDRNCDHGVFDITPEIYYQNTTQYQSIDILRKKYMEFPDYKPCDSYSCRKRIGAIWLQKVKKCHPLTAEQAKKQLRKFFTKYKRRFRLITYPAGLLTVSEIRRCLDSWERHDGFVPDVVVVDYADLMSADDGKVAEFRHRQDYVWKALRALSQERHVLMLTATQADADSYKRDRLSLSNFSEDKRKLAHVTAQFGINQDPQGREKKLGVVRINEIVVREGEFSTDNEVCVLQDLATGRAFLESFSMTKTSNGGVGRKYE